jgi:membrane fusion protein (multidrug efflux system)
MALIAGLVALAGLLGIWKYRAIQQAKAQPGLVLPEFVDVVRAETLDWRPTAHLVGTVIAKQSVTLANEIVGVVTEVNFQSGDTVEPGKVLVRFDTSTELADLAAAEAAEQIGVASIREAEARVRAAESALSLARSMHQRLTDAAKSESVSAIELDKDRATLETATADLEREKSALLRARAEHDQAVARAAQIRTLIAKKSLSSPFAARIGMRTIHPGQYLAEGSKIVELTELTDDIYVDFAVPQEYAARVEPGAIVIANSKMLGGDEVPIKVVSIDATVNPTTRNVRVRSSVANPGHRLKPGMFIDVEVPVEAAKPYVAIPTTAVRRAAYGDHVFVLLPDEEKAKEMPGAMRAHQRMVTLGADLGGRVIVLTGLQDGEQIASSGSFKLREGALVMKAPPPQPRKDAAPSGEPPASTSGDQKAAG